MIQISANQVTPQLRSLFDPADMPGAPRCFAVLDGSILGDILTDDLNNPTWAIVRQAALHATFMGGKLNPDVLEQAVSELRNEGGANFWLWPEDGRTALLPPEPKFISAGLEFTDRPVGEGLESYLNAVPEGCDVRRMNREIVERSLWGGGTATMFGGIDGFLENGLGFCLMKGNEILSEGYGDTCALGTIEMGTITHEGHRGNGYSTIICAHVIKKCEDMGYKTIWHCAKTNPASAAIARKLGYRTEREFSYIAYEASQQASH